MTKEKVTDLIVVRVDGGICSQMAFCSLGLSLEKRGYRVKYDLSFYRENGMDEDGRFPRNWDMPKAFPALRFEEATNAVYLVAGGSAGPGAFRADAISCAIPEAKLRGLWHYAYRLWRKLGLWLSDGTVRIGMFPAR